MIIWFVTKGHTGSLYIATRSPVNGIHTEIKKLLREPRESLGHLAPSPINRAIITNVNV